MIKDCQKYMKNQKFQGYNEWKYLHLWLNFQKIRLQEKLMINIIQHCF